MTIKLKKANMRRLVSLSAAGAGALGVAAGSANAGIIYSGIVDEKVGFGPGYGRSAIIAGPNGVRGTLNTLRISNCSSGICGKSLDVRLNARNGSLGTKFRFLAHPGEFSTDVSAFPLNAEFGAPAGSFGLGTIAGSNCAGTFPDCVTSDRLNGHPYTRFSTVDRYLLFRFTGGALPQPLYGWAQLDVSLPGNLAGPQVTLVDYAYDTSGAQIAAGDTGTPEPSTFATTGLAALALGAAGVRRWRKARKTT